ncbi:sugar ABC transporter permease [Deinococcus yavapaiensis]|uniref:Carbohydrate ABC transporter membrane protein 2 (CUT1 family) n=1 Tax=Deinococcus yavapaiensis KR-236 TaxID=694435 RepID=A0A318SAR2_9DEIO|nr:sugar ABC transporter permease [Deinococcus yavapaiensis]PYE56510.1 carbohydrate ABC transporter membrane protein 2 (CUT1 family) [Deinococcus yavapaiensis KR-236]
MTVSGSNPPSGSTHDTSVVYVHKEPSLLRRAVPWLVALAILVGLYFLVQALARPFVSGTIRPSFSILRIPNGWQAALLWLLGAVGLLALTSFIGKVWGERTSKRTISYWQVLGDQLTHLFLWLVIFVAVYPLFFVLIASFDPRNSLYQFFLPTTGNVFVRSGLWPNFANSSLDNYTRLFDGVNIPAWQWILLGVIAGAALALLVITFLRRRASDERAYERPSRTLTYVALGALALIVLFMSPTQFQGQGNESKFLLSVRNTFLVSGLTGFIAILLSTTAGYAMARLRFPGRFQTLLFFIFIQMFPVFLGLVAIQYLLFALGLSNSFTGLILAYSGGAIAFNTWIYKGYVESLPESLEEAALVDGATRWQAFQKVVLPLSGSMLVFIFLNQFIGTYAEYIISSQVMTGIENWTVGILLFSYTSDQFSTKWGVFAASAVMGALPIVALFYGFQRYFVSGAVAGGVKE